jgi:branched-chain amino acid transport system permease protein
MTVIVQQAINGIVNGSVYCLIAIGITLIFGLTGLVNFAHGSVMTLGSYIALAVTAQVAGWLGLLVALVAAGAALGVLGIVLETGLFRYTIKRPINGFVVSLGLILVLENGIALHWGTNPETVTDPVSTSVTLTGISVPTIRLIVLVTALALSCAFYVFLTRTRTGTALRCCQLDRDTAALMGINVPRIQTLAFAAGSVLAGAGGALLATIYTFTPFFGETVVVKGFVIALAGGLGNVAGAFWAALLFGVCESLSVQVGLGAWSSAIAFVFIVLLLMVRPSGLLGGTRGSAVT